MQYYDVYDWPKNYVEDSLLSLNTPDIIEIHDIFESADTQDPSAPKVTLSSILSL